MTTGEVIMLVLLVVNIIFITMLTLKLSPFQEINSDLMKKNRNYGISPIKFCEECRVISSMDSTFCHLCGKELLDKEYGFLSDLKLIKYGRLVKR